MAEETNPFEDLFNGGFNDNDLLEKFFRAARSEDHDPKATGLLKTFTEEVRKGDREFLEQAVIEYREEVFERDSDIPLVRAYSTAAIFVGNLPIGQESLELIKDLSSNQKQAVGILAYEMGRPQEAVERLEGIENKVAPARIVYSLSLCSQGDRDPQAHTEILQPLLEKSSLANTIIGTLYFNQGKPFGAEGYFAKAAELSPKSEKAQLNLMRAKIANNKGDEVFSQMNEFYVQTGSELSADEIQQELERKELDIPKLRIKNLFSIVRDLI